MRLIKTMSKEDLLMCSVDLVSKTYIELGQNNVEEDTISITMLDALIKQKFILKMLKMLLNQV